MANTKLTRTMGTPTDATKQTMSVWVKLSSNSNYGGIVSAQYDSGTGGAGHWTGNNNSIYSNWTTNGSVNVETQLKAFGRDFNGWYNIVSVQDASQSGSDKCKVWINGVLQTTFEVDNRSNFSTHANWFANGKTLYVGSKHNDSLYFDGVMSHLHLCDGYAYQASDFGSFDSTTGEWKINASPNVNYGNEGFFILKDGNSVTDQSGNGNNFTVAGGTLTKTEDNPSNIFATINPLYKKPQSNPSELTNGNTGVIGGSAHRADAPTIAVNKGKWYMEAKAISGNTTKWWWGLGKVEVVESKQSLGNTDNFIYGDVAGTQGVYSDNLRVDGSTAISSIFSGAIAANDIAMIAVDLDNQKVWYGLNGTWNNGSASQSSTFNSSSPDSTALTAGEFYYIGVGNENTKWHTNYGNGYFGTTAVSSAGTNASNFGIFEYDVPAGFTAICTKGLNL